MAKSRVEITINSLPDTYSSIGIFDNSWETNSIYTQFRSSRYAAYVCEIGSTINECAQNLHDALKADWDHRGPYTWTVVGNVLTIEATKECILFSLAISNAAISVNFYNEPCSDPDENPDFPDLDLVTANFTEADASPCSYVKLSIETTQALAIITSPEAIGDIINPNTDNPVEFEVLRDSGTVLVEGEDANGKTFSQTFTVPEKLTLADIAIHLYNESDQSRVEVNNFSTLDLWYSLDGVTWQTLNEFYVPLNDTYTMHVKDAYGCQISEIFLVTGFFPQVAREKSIEYCGSLHELNKGKYLNLFTKQHTMKLGFVCNKNPETVKIFRHIQMVLSTDYSIKKATVKTSLDQERYIPGDHVVYKIREGQHSVPLKNPRDWDDLRGNWAYLEVEIESINNQKVDLFSILTYLRQSSI